MNQSIIEYQKELSNEQESILCDFFANGNFISAIDKVNESEPFKYLWDDYTLLKDYLSQHNQENIFFYTLVDCDDDEAWIIEGRKLVNRIGYFISTIKIDIAEEGVRYW